MKLMPYLKKGLYVYKREIVVIVVSFLVLPMAMALIYGNLQRNMFDVKRDQLEPIRVHLQYNSEGKHGAVLRDILSRDEVKAFIHEEEMEPEYQVIISDDFKTLEISGEDEGKTGFIVLKNFLETLLSSLNKYEILESTINNLDIEDMEKHDLLQRTLGALEKNQDTPAVSEEILEGYKTLSSIEYFTISIFSFTSMTMILTLAGFYYREVREGIVKRSLSTPNNRRDYFLGYILSSFILSITISSIYVLINRLRGLAFTGSLLNLAVIILLQGLLCSSAVGAVIAFIKREATASTVMSFLIIIPSIFGGTFFYNEIVGSRLVKTLMNSVPNALILNSYKNLSITDSLSGAYREIIAMVVLSLILLFSSLIKIEGKWEV